MSDYVVTMEDGRFVLSARRLVRVAVFEEATDARAAAEFFATREAADDSGEAPVPTAAAAPAPVAVSAGVTETTKTRGAEPAPAQAAQAGDDRPDDQPEDWTGDRLEAAFKRLSAGEKLGDVARDMGGDWRSLRGRWANHKRYLVAAGQQPCSMCSRPFTPSVSSPDMCARCARA